MHMQHNKDRNKTIIILSTWKTVQPCCKLSTSLLHIILWTIHDRMCFIIAGAHPSTLHFIGDHDNDSSILLPNHSPEVINCFRQAALCGYVPPLWPGHLTTDVVCINVVRAHNTWVWVVEDNSCLVNCGSVCVWEFRMLICAIHFWTHCI